ncbi:hypothetical protein HFN89_00080 [Rhizobium laguerreae]|nr:hypothetical protein [Rhizobium laguerreae]
MVKLQSEFTETSRTRVREIKARMHEAGTSVTLQQAYELLAKESGYRTWAAMKTSMEAIENANQLTEAGTPCVEVGETETWPLLDECRSRTQETFIALMRYYGGNPVSVSARVAYDIADALSASQVREVFSNAPELADIDTRDEYYRSFFGDPKTTLDSMRFAIAVDLMKSTVLRPNNARRLRGRAAL